MRRSNEVRERRMYRLFLAAAAASVCAVSAATAAEHNKRVSDPNRKICRTIAETGSRLNRSRACHTAAEWEDLRRQTELNIEKIQAQARATSGGGG
jgi:hypothetical protein